MFIGSITALTTPFLINGDIDWHTLERQIDFQIENGTSALVVCGTTAESPTLSEDEQLKIISHTIAYVHGRVPVIAGTGSNNTEKAIFLTKKAQDMGADAALLVCPYYNKPSQAGLVAHHTAIHDQTDIPLILYNIPGRSIVDMTLDTISTLAALPRIIGIKDATADVSRPPLLRNRVGDSFYQWAGDDATALAFRAQGGHGCISVTSNIYPAECASMHAAWDVGDYKTAFDMRDLLAPIHDLLFAQTSPSPVKYALSQIGFGLDNVRLPLVPTEAALKSKIDLAMDQLKAQKSA